MSHSKDNVKKAKVFDGFEEAIAEIILSLYIEKYYSQFVRSLGKESLETR
jgi:hypothetical protein